MDVGQSQIKATAAACSGLRRAACVHEMAVHDHILALFGTQSLVLWHYLHLMDCRMWLSGPATCTQKTTSVRLCGVWLATLWRKPSS